MLPEANGRTFAQKALARAAKRAAVEVGEVVDARPDIALSHDNSAAIREIWSELGQDCIAIPEKIAITLDHAVPAPTARHAENHAVIRRFVAEQGIRHFFEIGRGICHQVLSEEALVLPGQLVLGADSHTPHFGWLGAFGAGIGRSEMAAVWATGELWLTVPESIRLEITGELPPWVEAKDVALAIIQRHGAAGGLSKSVELTGSTVAGLDLEERMVLANMMAEFGAKCSYFAPDERVFAFLAERRGEAPSDVTAHALYPDTDATYAARASIRAEELRPQVACPHRVDKTVDVEAVADVRVNQALIGTCTNGRLGDIRQAHRVLRGRRLAHGVRLLIVPASSVVMAAAIERGYVTDLMDAGAVFGTPGCGPCMGNHLGVLAPGEVCISSANRNFKGRMGTPEAEIYLASPAVVAASAVAGRIASPEEVMA